MGPESARTPIHLRHARIPRAAALVAALVITGTSIPALASGGLSEDSFRTILVLLAVVSVAYVVAHVLSEWLSRQFGIASGVEYLVLGAIVGPGFGLITPEIVHQVSPALVLGEGSLGLLTGILLNFRDRTSTTMRAGVAGFNLALTTVAIVLLVPAGLVTYFWGLETSLTYLPHMLTAAAIAAVADLGPLRSLIAFLGARGDGTDVVLRVARATSSFAVIAFGVVFCLFKPASDLLVGVEFDAWGSFAFWFGIHLLIGGTLGLIFTLFLSRDYEDEKILTVVIGMVIFTSGVAYYLKLSPIFVCFVLGLVLANICRQSQHVRVMLLSVERPLYIVLFFFVGANLAFDVAWWSWALAVPYLLLRALGRGVGGVLASRPYATMRRFPPLGQAMWAPGALSAAMLLNFNDVFSGAPAATEVFVGLVLAVMVSEPIAYRLSRTWLIDATDVAVAPADRSVAEVLVTDWPTAEEE